MDDDDLILVLTTLTTTISLSEYLGYSQLGVTLYQTMDRLCCCQWCGCKISVEVKQHLRKDIFRIYDYKSNMMISQLSSPCNVVFCPV